MFRKLLGSNRIYSLIMYSSYISIRMDFLTISLFSHDLRNAVRTSCPNQYVECVIGSSLSDRINHYH